MKKATAEVMKTYIIQKSDETIRITVPAEWKVTFGPGVPRNNKNGFNHNQEIGWALRFYESTDKQRAIYTNVRGFFDASIKTERLVKAVKVETKSENNHKGSKANEVVEKAEEWIPLSS